MRAFAASALGLCTLLPLAAAATDAPPASDVAPASETAPDWTRNPDPSNCGGRLPRYYPPKAQALGRKGIAVIRCAVTSTGSADHCVVVSEDPPGLGFGEAALRMSCLFKIKPKKVNGVPVDGAEVTIPLRFDLK